MTDPLTLEIECQNKRDAKLVFAALKYASQSSSDPMDAADLNRLANEVRAQCVDHYERPPK